MKSSKKFATLAATTLAVTTLFSASAFAAPAQNNSWRSGDSRGGYAQSNDRYVRKTDRHEQFVSGTVQRIDRRSAIVEVRNGNRTITVSMVRRNSARGADLSDLRRGDYVKFAGDWSRGGFEAWRIDSVDHARGRGRR